jgi:hypothetical protein
VAKGGHGADDPLARCSVRTLSSSSLWRNRAGTAGGRGKAVLDWLRHLAPM